MSHNYTDLTRNTTRHLSILREDVPNVMKAFGTLAGAATTDGALDRKTKELIALGISVAVRCDDCIGFHVQALVKLGASRAEVAETLGAAVYMGGGLSLMYAAHAMEAYQEFSESE